jgi:hypothetical protein
MRTARSDLRRIFATQTKEALWKFNVHFEEMTKAQKKIENNRNQLRSLPDRLLMAEQKLDRIQQLRGTIEEMNEWSVKWTDLEGGDHDEGWSQKETFEESLGEAGDG